VSTYGRSISKLTGSWIDYIEFDGEKIWDRNDDKSKAEVPKAPQKLLYSDSRFRSDSKAVREQDWSLGEAEKLRLEEIQRGDRKLRESFWGKSDH